MKKNRLTVLLLCLLVIAAGVFTACGSKQEEPAEQPETEATETKVLGDTELQDVALADAGYDITAASNIVMGPEVTSGTRSIRFNIGDAEYSYDIDVNTGEIVNSTKPDTAPDVPVDPVELAMNEAEKLPEFSGASNINAKAEGDSVTVTFDSGGESYTYIYDVQSGTLEKQ